MRKTILITGCSSGFGKALCDEFSKQNYYVIADEVCNPDYERSRRGEEL